MNENIPNQVKKFAQENGFNSISWAGKTNDGDFYAIGVTGKNDSVLPIGMPHYLFFKNGDCSIICDDDLRITSMLDK